MKIPIASDHAGFKVKEKTKQILEALKFDYIDLSPDFNPKDDYPDHALRLAEKVKKSRTKGILLCGTGMGISMAANKVPGIRAALCHTKKEARLARAHNNANILVLEGWGNHDDLKTVIKTFITTKFDGGRHRRRVKKISAIENMFLKN
jgi:ribose 5-phosphate isomerase B